MKKHLQIAMLLITMAWADGAASVTAVRAPEGGIQPQVAVDNNGVLHMLYFTGDAMHGDLRYVKSLDGGATFSSPIQVNSIPGSAIATGNIRGAHLALGPKGRIHAAWNGTQQAGAPGKLPMLYTRLKDSGAGFEPERNLIQAAYGIDGGGAVAADQSGHVYVFWHAPIPGSKGEENRRVWLARSNDDGKSFDHEKIAWDKQTGACACCSLQSFADDRGSVYVLFRSAIEMTHRDIYLLESHDRGQTFDGAEVSKWNVGYCVMSSESLAQGPAGVLAAWETEKQVYFAKIDPATGKIGEPIGAPGSTNARKHPVVAANKSGETLLAWTEGMGWKKGGGLSWQVFDKSGKPQGEPGKLDGVPTWSLIAAFARPDGGFTVVY